MPPSRQSVASGIFQTVTKLCMTIGFGIATAIFNSVKQDPQLASYWDKPTQPYTAVFWCSVACSGLGVCLVPFLTIQTQGGKAKAEPEPSAAHPVPDLAVAEDKIIELSIPGR